MLFEKSGLYRNLQLATPANQILMPGYYLTNNFDFICLVPGAPSSNVSFDFPTILEDPRGNIERQINHSLLDTYLQTFPKFKQLRDRVLQGMVDEASELAGNCGTPPMAFFNYLKDENNSLKFSFDGTGSSDIDNDIASYNWYVDGQLKSTSLMGSFNYTFPDVGQYSVSLEVIDSEGNRSLIFELPINVEAGENIKSIFTYEADGDLATTFDASKSEGLNGEPLPLDTSYFWDFGDGVTGFGKRNTHTYLSPGPYSVTLTISTSSGLTDSSTQSFTAPVCTPKAIGCGGSPGVRYQNGNGSCGGFVAFTSTVASGANISGNSEICGGSNVSFVGSITKTFVNNATIMGSGYIIQSQVNSSIEASGFEPFFLMGNMGILASTFNAPVTVSNYMVIEFSTINRPLTGHVISGGNNQLSVCQNNGSCVIVNSDQ